MGWLFMRDMGGYATPRSYLDNQFTYQRDTHRLTVLASAMVGSTYYAACERREIAVDIYVEGAPETAGGERVATHRHPQAERDLELRRR